MEKYLLDVWPPENLEDVCTWGIHPLKRLHRIFDKINQELNGDEPNEMFLHYEAQSKLEHLEEVLSRFDDYEHLLKRRLAEFSPDDPLLKDPRPQLKAIIAERRERMKKRERQRDEADMRQLTKKELWRQILQLTEEQAREFLPILEKAVFGKGIEAPAEAPAEA